LQLSNILTYLLLLDLLLTEQQEVQMTCKKLSDEVLMWLSLCSEVQMAQLMPSPSHHLLLY